MWFEKSDLKILRKLGEGLNSEVYLAKVRQHDLDKDYLFALKVLKHTTELDHFKKECDNLLLASGKHLVSFRGWHHFRGRPALVLDYIDGATLYDLLSSYRLNQDEASYIKSEVQAGLEELRDARLFHGDLSLKNIMLSRSGEVKLIDFGLTMWKSQRIEASPQFLCPDILNGSSPSFSTDLFSLEKIHEILLEDVLPALDSTPPQVSLSQKIISLNSHSTEKLSLNIKASSNSINNYVALFVFLMLYFFPTNPQAQSRSFDLIDIRSVDWLAVRLHEKEPWCFTPCQLKLRPQQSQAVFWKGAQGKGVFYYFPSQKKEILQISRSNLK